MRNVVTRGWKKLHSEELHNLYSSPNIIRMIRPRSMRQAGYVACMGIREMHKKFWLESLKGRYHSEDIHIDGRIILKWIFGTQGE
jgi:hypothetical protein